MIILFEERLSLIKKKPRQRNLPYLPGSCCLIDLTTGNRAELEVSTFTFTSNLSLASLGRFKYSQF